MAKVESKDCKRFHIWLDKDDAEWFKGMFGNDLGFSRSIRAVMRSYRTGIEEKINSQSRARGLSEAEQTAIVEQALGPAAAILKEQT